MAFYSGSQTNAAGSLVAILDARLVNNEYWSVYDTPATNERVYECSYPGAEVYLHVADNQSGYATVAIWEGWDADAGTGIGLYSTTTIYWRKTTGTYWVILHDTYFIYVCFGTNLNYGHFCGNIDRFCPEFNTPILVGVRNTTTPNINPMGSLSQTTTAGACVYLDFQTMRYLGCYAEYADTAPAPINGDMGCMYRNSGGTVKGFLEETMMVNNYGETLGIMRGVMGLGTLNSSGIVHGDTVTDGDSDVWECVNSGFGVLLRKT